MFTHNPPEGQENDFELLKHNIDTAKDGIESTYMKKRFEVNRHNAFEDPEIKYKIHAEDKPTVKKYKQ